MIILGIDQSHAATGIVLIDYDPVRNPVIMKAMTVFKNITSRNIRAALYRLPLEKCRLMVREEGFFSADYPDVGLEIERVGGWCEAICEALAPSMPQMRVTAKEWRYRAWGSQAVGLRTLQAKKHSILFATEHGIKDPDDHQGDAFGIAIYGGWKLTEGKKETWKLKRAK